jgi:signal transduction histidine kinase
MSLLDRSRVATVQSREWLLFFGLTTFGTALVVIAEPTGPPFATGCAVTILIVIQLVYLLVVGPTVAGVHVGGPRAWIFAAVVVVGLSVAMSLNTWAALALFAVSPQVFLVLAPRPASGVIVALAVARVGVHMLTQPFTVRDLIQQLGAAAFIIMFCLFFSRRMLAVTRQSLERQHLIDELHEREAEVRALSAARGAEGERTRIAREMHDTLAQGFTSIVTLGYAVQGELENDPPAARKHVEFMTVTAQENLVESRRMIAALSPAPLAKSSLTEAIDRVVQVFAEESGVHADARVIGVPHIAMPSIDVVALRLVQESLSNAKKHAHAGHVTVSLRYAARALTIEVTDDGVGFDTAAPWTGFGLGGMRARVLDSGGTTTISSAPGKGTTVRATLPLRDPS